MVFLDKAWSILLIFESTSFFLEWFFSVAYLPFFIFENQLFHEFSPFRVFLSPYLYEYNAALLMGLSHKPEKV